MSKVREVIARIEAERARGVERQTVTSHKPISRPLRSRMAPKPPRAVITGRRAVAKTTKAETADKKPAKPKTAAETPAEKEGDES